MFSSKSFIILALLFGPLILFELIFWICKIWVQFHSLTGEYPMILAPFIEATVFSPLSIFGSFVKYYLSDYAWVSFWALDSVPFALFVCFYTVLVTITL